MKKVFLAAIAAGLAAFAPLGSPVYAVIAPTDAVTTSGPGTDAFEVPAEGSEAVPAGAAASEAGAAEAPATAAPEASEAAAPTGSYTPMKPEAGKGMPTAFEADPIKSMGFQDQYTEDGAYALWMHDYLLLPIVTSISLFVLGLLLYVVVRFNRRANPQASRTTHNTLIEVVWTVVPVLILVIIAVPSITLLARQYENPPEDAVTIKVIGNQWNWEYVYPDHGEISFVSNMLKEEADVKSGDRFRTDDDGPAQLAVDNRMVVPAGVPLRIQTTASTVIHAFAVPSLWFKMDAVPGRLNEKLLIIDKPGVYFGQCSELCGALHGFMPIAIEALPPAKFAEWVRAQGGTMPGETGDAAPAATAAKPAGAGAGD
jgi:cytochrome c oxidase subunit 2